MTHLVWLDLKVKAVGLDMPVKTTSTLFIDFTKLSESVHYHTNALALTVCKKLIE